jgi:hypothetical protein
VSGILSVLYTIWSHSKEDYMNYCRPKEDFWRTIASTLYITRKRGRNSSKDNENTAFEDDEELNEDRYLDYFGFDSRIYENEMLRFDELILEANVKCVAFSFKILSLDIFDYVYLRYSISRILIDIEFKILIFFVC